MSVPKKRIAPDIDAALGLLWIIVPPIMLAMDLAMCQTASIPQGFAP